MWFEETNARMNQNLLTLRAQKNRTRSSGKQVSSSK